MVQQLRERWGSIFLHVERGSVVQGLVYVKSYLKE